MTALLRNTAIAALISAPLTASAATIADGTYAASEIFTPPYLRSVWSPNMVDGLNTGLGLFWDFDDGATLEIFDNGGQALLKGVARNLLDDGLAFEFDIAFVESTPGTNRPFCQFNGAEDQDCDNKTNSALIADGLVDPSIWDYYDFVAGKSSFFGIEKMLGLTYSISDKTGGVHFPQVGENANALVVNGEDGMSFWYDFALEGGVDITQNGYTFFSSGNGDFNFNINVVPLPTGGLMLLAALAGFGAIRARQD